MIVIHSRLLVWACGMTVTPRLIVIHPRFRGDAGLLAHEKVHVRQMQRDGLLRFWWRYASSRRHRLAYEVEAYRVSMAHGCTLASAARTLATGYWLGIDERAARAALVGAAEATAEARAKASAQASGTGAASAPADAPPDRAPARS